MNCPKCTSSNTEAILIVSKQMKEFLARTINKPFECKDCKYIFNGHPEIFRQRPLTDKEK